MFQLSMTGGMALGFPDVCKTPMPLPVPIPYPNISTAAMANPATVVMSVLTDGTPSLNLISEIPLSNGDEPGVLLGLISELIMGPTEFIMGSVMVLQEGCPAQRLTSVTGHNGLAMNCPGVCLVPSQVTVLVMA